MKTTATASADAPTLAEEEFFGAEVADSVAEFDAGRVRSVQEGAACLTKRIF
jgi:hypothetical protein